MKLPAKRLPAFDGSAHCAEFAVLHQKPEVSSKYNSNSPTHPYNLGYIKLHKTTFFCPSIVFLGESGTKGIWD